MGEAASAAEAVAAGAPGEGCPRLREWAHTWAATDRPGAIALYQTIEKELLHDSPALFLGTQVYQRAYQSSIGGLVDNPAYPSVVFVYNLTPHA